MDAIDLTNMPAVEVLSLIRKGKVLLCPKCQAALETIPKNWTDASPLNGVACPNNQKHFLIYSEPERASKNMKGLIKEIIGKSKKIPQ